MRPLLVAAAGTLFLLSTRNANAQYPPQQGQPQEGQGLQAGGLAPPPPMEQDPESAQTEEKLQQAEEEDAGRGLEFFWINAEVGGEHLGLQTFKANNIVDAGIVETSQTGLVYGGGLGVRLLFITVGARFRLGDFSAWQLWTLNGEVGLRFPLGNIEPYFTLGAGYASLGAFGAGNLGGGLNSENVDITGYNIRGGGGIDWYVTPVFSIGASLTAEMIGLTRPGVDPSLLMGMGTPSGAEGQVYLADGSSLGFGVTLTAVLGLHF